MQESLVLRLAGSLVKDGIVPMRADPRASVFLAGGVPDGKHKCLREEIAKALSEPPYEHRYRAVMPEGIFRGLMMKQDLLELEGALAQSVDAVVVCPESPGSMAELGAFALHPQLSRKLIAVNQSKYQRKASFVNKGPLKHLQRIGNPVIWWDEKTQDITKDLLPALCKQIDRVKESVERVTPDIANPLAADGFVLPFVSLVGPVTEEQVCDCVTSLVATQPDLVDIGIRKALGSLRLSGKVTYRKPYFDVSSSGYAEVQTIVRALGLVGDFDRLRSEVINCRFHMRGSGEGKEGAQAAS